MTDTVLRVSVNGDIVAHEIMRAGLKEIVREHSSDPSFSGERAAEIAAATLDAAEKHEGWDDHEP